MRALMYHKIGDGRYGISEELFWDHCKMISNYNDKEVLLTFDDGHPSIMKAAEILDQTHLKALFFVITSKIGDSDHVTKEEIKDLLERGHRIGSHGHTHRFFNELSRKELKEELMNSSQVLIEMGQKNVVDISLPGGRFNRDVLDCLAESSFKQVWSSEPSFQFTQMPLWRRGRDCILYNMKTEYVKDLLDGKMDKWRQWRYKILCGFKKIVGDNLYHRMTVKDE